MLPVGDDFCGFACGLTLVVVKCLLNRRDADGVWPVRAWFLVVADCRRFGKYIGMDVADAGDSVSGWRRKTSRCVYFLT